MIANELMVTTPPEEHPGDHLDRGVDLARQGKFDEAEASFRLVIRLNPGYAEAHNNLGNVLGSRGRHEEAAACYRESLRLKPDYAKASNNLGNALRERGRYEEAEAAHRAALRLRPVWAEACNDLGLTLTSRGKFEEAINSFGEALRHRPGYPDALNNLGIAQVHWGRFEAAEVSFRQALRLQPNFPEAHNNLGNVLARRDRREDALACYREAIRLRPGYARAHHNLANTLTGLGRPGEADPSFLEALRLKPDDSSIHNDRAIALANGDRHEAALEAYREALRLRPDYPEAHNNIGNVLRELGRLEESATAHREALRLRPDYSEAHNNLGITLSTLGRLDESAASYTRALGQRPDSAHTHLNRSMVWLRAGRFELGWPEYEWRWRRKESPPPKFIQTPWNGGALGGRTILLYAEQGSGDTFQFIRYAPLVQGRGGRVVLQCSSGLVPLLSRCPGIDRLVPQGSPLPEFDVHAALMSLASLFHTDLASIPAEVPYLFADEELVGDWRRRLDEVAGFRIGVVWQGNPKYGGDRARSYPLRALAPLARLEGVSLVSLQVDHGLDQLSGIDFPIRDLQAELKRAPGMFMDAAAAARNLDLVVSCDSALAHLAGGLGVPTWVGLPFSSDWRWLVGRVDSPWYPTMRLFRQPSSGDWDTVFRRMAGELRERLASPSSSSPSAPRAKRAEIRPVR